MTDRVLFVDDDTNLLASFQRQFRGAFPMETAESGDAALDLLADKGPFAVVVSDYRMPGLTGTEFLTRVAERSPDTVRMLLTGYAELQTAIDAVNRGQVFRFLTKPCPPDVLRGVVQAGLDQYRLVHAQKDLLENTLRGSIKVFSDMLGIVNPRAFGKTGRLRKLVAAMAEAMRLPDAWQLDMAAMLALVGCVSVPEAVWAKLEHGDRLTLDEEVMINKHPRVGYELLAGIPRLGPVAEAVRYQDRRYDGWDDTGLTFSGKDIPIGARLLKAASDYDAAVQRGAGPLAAFKELEAHKPHYDPAVLDALKQAVGRSGPGVLMTLPKDELRAGMTLTNGLFNRHGVRMMAAAQEVTPALLSRIQNMTLREPIAVWVPPALVEEIAAACDLGTVLAVVVG